MTQATTEFALAIAKLIYNNDDTAVNGVPIGTLGGLRGSTSAGSFYIALFSGDPMAGQGSIVEANYTGYQRIAVPRTSAELAVTAPSTVRITNVNEVLFIASTGGSTPTVDYFGICTGSTPGAADILSRGTLTGSLTISSAVQPRFAPGALNAYIA